MSGDNHGPDRQTDPPDNGGAVDRADQGDTGVQASTTICSSNITITDCTITNDPGIGAAGMIYPQSMSAQPYFTAMPPVWATSLAFVGSVMTVGTYFSGGSVYDAAPPHDGVVAGEIIAWRSWTIRYDPADGDLLRSVFVSHLWQPQATMTGDIDKDEGVHAFKTQEQARSYAMENVDFGVLGRVKLWGDVVEHDIGYRASNAKIVTLDELIDKARPRIFAWCRRDKLADLRIKYGPLEGCEPFVLP